MNKEDSGKIVKDLEEKFRVKKMEYDLIKIKIDLIKAIEDLMDHKDSKLQLVINKFDVITTGISV